MNFATALRNESNFTRTENGAVALKSTTDARLDLFSTIGALREADENRICTLFAEAYKQDPLFATKILFYGRDIREGLGERKTFRTLLKYTANHHPEAIRPNLDLIGVFGRFDDLYTLVGTKLEDEMWATMKKQLEEDVQNMTQGHAVSLLGKWLKTINSHNKETRKLALLTANKLGYTEPNYRKIVRDLRKHIDVVEVKMSTGRWNEITYSAVPSRAMKLYRSAFMKHDPEGFDKYLSAVEKGEARINASTLFPYDIVEEYLYKGQKNIRVLESQWKALPNYVEEGENVLIMADVSGSMYGRPMASSIGLALYFAEHNTGAYHNLFMTFSGRPSIVSVQGETLEQKINNIRRADWGMNTDLYAAFLRVLDIAIKHGIAPEEMPKAIVVISDMEIDCCTSQNWTFYDLMATNFAAHGYVIPNVIFWNVNSRHDVFHADAKRKGVQLASGQSVTVFKQILENLGFNPVEAMENTINSERYACITIEC